MKLQIPFSTPANIGLRQSKTRASENIIYTHNLSVDLVFVFYVGENVFLRMCAGFGIFFSNILGIRDTELDGGRHIHTQGERWLDRQTSYA